MPLNIKFVDSTGLPRLCTFDVRSHMLMVSKWALSNNLIGVGLLYHRSGGAWVISYMLVVSQWDAGQNLIQWCWLIVLQIWWWSWLQWWQWHAFGSSQLFFFASLSLWYGVLFTLHIWFTYIKVFFQECIFMGVNKLVMEAYENNYSVPLLRKLIAEFTLNQI